jgi:hypothetical protein
MTEFSSEWAAIYRFPNRFPAVRSGHKKLGGTLRDPATTSREATIERATATVCKIGNMQLR